MSIANKFQIAFFFIVAAISSNSYSQSKFKVVLDAGHGGKDYGAIYTGHIEKNIALAVVQKVGKILEKDKSIEVIYTRKTDVFIELIERTNIANKADANIFVSIHCNANKNTSASGSETYVMGVTKNASNLEAAKLENQVVTLEADYKEKYEGYDPKSPQTMIGMTLMQEEYLENSINLASKIQDNFTDQLKRKNRGVKQAQFLVLHKAYMPRVLVEMGFISNPEEGKIKALKEFVDYVRNVSKDIRKKAYLKNKITNNFVPTIGFSDDDIRNVEKVKSHFEKEPDNIIKTYSTAGGVKKLY